MASRSITRVAARHTRRALAVAAATALVAVGGCVPLRSFETQVQGEVERVFAALRESGVAATHGTIRFDLWSRTLHIERIALAGEPGSASKLEVGSLRAATLAMRGTTLVAGAVELTDVKLERGASGASERRLAASIPNIRVQELVLPQKPPTGTPAGDAAMIAAVIQAVRVGTIVVPAIDLAITSPAPPVAAGAIGFLGTAAARRPDPRTDTYTYAGVRIERIADGRIGSVRGERIDIEGASVSGIVAGFSLSELDVAPLLASSPTGPRAKQDRAVGRIAGPYTLGATSLRTPDGELRLAGAAGDGIGIDKEHLSPVRLLEVAALLNAGGQASPSQITALAGPLADLYEGIELGRLEVRGVRLASTSLLSAGNASFGSVVAEGLGRGRLQRLRLHDLAVTPPGLAGGTPTRIGAIAFEGFQLARLMRLIPTVDPTARQRPPDPQQVLSLLEGIEVSDIVVPDPVAGRPLRLRRAKLQWSRLVNGVPAEVRLALKGEWPLSPNAVALLPLRQMGFDAVAIDAEIGARYDAEAGRLTIAPYRVVIDRVGALEARLAFTDLPRTAFTLDAGRLGRAVPEMAIEEAELRLADGGLVDLLDRQPVPGRGTGAARAELLASFRRDLDPTQPASSYRALINAIERFLAAPRQSLAIGLSPRVRTSVEELSHLSLLAGRGALQQQLERFDLKAAGR